MPGFTGWPPAALDFLRDLEANNDRDWFKANRTRYEEHLVDPARALADELAELGSLHLFRPWRDTRFHPGPPIKEHIAFVLGGGGSGGFYAELSLDGLFLGAGLYEPAPDQLERYRQAVDHGRRAAGLTRALRRAGGEGLRFHDPDLKRTPRGYPAEHPRADLLRVKHLIVHRRDALGPWLHTPECGGRVRAAFEAASPLVRWLQAHVGPSLPAPASQPVEP